MAERRYTTNRAVDYAKRKSRKGRVYKVKRRVTLKPLKRVDKNR